MRKALVLGLSVLAFGTYSVAGAAIVNGGFETPVVGGSNLAIYGNGSDIGGWTVFGDELVLRDGYSEPCDSGCGALNFQSFEGSQHLDITGAGNTGASGVFQDFATVTGQVYTLSFYLGNINGAAAGDSRYLLPASVRVQVAGVDQSFTNSAISGNNVNWALQQISFTATSSTTQLRFTNATTGDNFAGIDDVVVSTVPEPATLAMLGTGLGLVAFMRRRIARK